MASQTPNLNLYKVNPETDGEMTFNVKTMLNENWDRLDESIGEVHQEITTHKADYVRHPGYAVTAGTGNAYTITTDPAPTAYVDGMGIVIRVNRTNTRAATLNWNGLGAVPIVDAKGNALIAGKIPNGARLSLRYSSAAENFQLQGEGGEYGTATPADVLAGKTIGTEGGLVTGTMQDRGNVTATLTNQGQQYTIPVGKHGGSGIITANITNLNAANIKSGVSVGGVAGTFTSDATATAAQILTGQTAYTSGTKLTGTMPNRGAVSNTITTQGGQYTIPAGYHSGSGKVTASFTNLIAANVKKGVNIGGIVGTLEEGIVIPINANFSDWDFDKYAFSTIFSKTFFDGSGSKKIRFSSCYGEIKTRISMFQDYGRGEASFSVKKNGVEIRQTRFFYGEEEKDIFTDISFVSGDELEFTYEVTRDRMTMVIFEIAGRRAIKIITEI